MSDSSISHVPLESCHNVKTRKNTDDRCTNPATHGSYCGRHYKNPVKWNPICIDTESIAARVHIRRKEASCSTPTTQSKAIRTLQAWYRMHIRFNNVRKRGLAYYNRSITTNDSDFFSTDSMNDIEPVMFFSFTDDRHHAYGFDVRSIYTLIYRAHIHNEPVHNPFTRAPIENATVQKVHALVKHLRKRNISVEWAPLTPPTPEQQWRMKVVDLFTKIDELNYYSSPDWFIHLDVYGQREFYTELQAIWTYRAGLSMTQKNTIVPNYIHTLFRYPSWALATHTLESMQKINTGVIRTIITSADDRNDRILGAMYVMSALTLVNEQARTAYPWLYESVIDTSPTHAYPAPQRRGALGNLLGIRWLQELLARAPEQDSPPLLLLPPPHTEPTSIPQSESESKSESDSDE